MSDEKHNPEDCELWEADSAPGDVTHMAGMPDGSVTVMTSSGEVWRPVKYGKDFPARWEIMIDHSPQASERDQQGPNTEEQAYIKAELEAADKAAEAERAAAKVAYEATRQVTE